MSYKDLGPLFSGEYVIHQEIARKPTKPALDRGCPELARIAND